MCNVERKYFEEEKYNDFGLRYFSDLDTVFCLFIDYFNPV